MGGVKAARKGNEMFRITAGKGLHIKFENGWTVSVQFGAGNYCDNYHEWIVSMATNLVNSNGCVESTNAEVGVFNPKEELVKVPLYKNEDTVDGYKTPAEVLAIMNWAANQN